MQQDKRGIRPSCLTAGELGSHTWTQWTHCKACYGNPNGPPTGCLSLPWSPASLPLWHSYIHEYRHTSGCGPKLKLKWMTDLPMKMNVCVCVCVDMHVCEYVYVCAPCRVKHKTAAEPGYERKSAVALTHISMWLHELHILAYSHTWEGTVYLISQAEPGVWIRELLRVAGLSVCCSHGLIGATTGNAACT